MPSTSSPGIPAHALGQPQMRRKNLYSRHKSRGQAFVVQTYLVRFSLMSAHEAKFIRHMEGIYQREHLSGVSHKPFAHLGHVHTD